MTWQKGDPVEISRVGKRADCLTMDQFEPFLRRNKNFNIAVMPVIQVDSDSEEGSNVARELGVSSTESVWIVRTRRGWRAIYRLDPDRVGLRNLIKANAVDLDLLINSPALVPPSIHPSGFGYRWVPGNSPLDFPFQELGTPPVPLLNWWETASNPRRVTTNPRDPIYGSGFVEEVRRAVEASQYRGLSSPNSEGWQSGNCVFPDNHSNGDRNASFSVNFKLSGWTCFGGCGSGSLTDLASRLKITIPVIHGRGRHIYSVRVTEGAVR